MSGDENKSETGRRSFIDCTYKESNLNLFLIKEGQKKGEIATKDNGYTGNQWGVPKENTPKTLSDIGISRKELWIAREILRSQGARTDLTSDQKIRSWAGYCEDIGSSKQVISFSNLKKGEPFVWNPFLLRC